MDLMDGIQVVPAFANAIRAVWAHPLLAEILESIGGPGALDEGLQELRVGSVQVVADLLAAREHGVSLADAVFDPENFPHLTRLHGRIFDFMMLRVPALWTPFVKTLLRLRLPDDGLAFRRTVAHVAFRSMNDGESALAQLMLFEVLCVQQRLTLLRQNESLESIGGRQRAIEVLAQQEIEAPVAVEEYKDALLATEDPVDCLVKVVTMSLVNCVDELNQWFKELRHLPTDLAARRVICEQMKLLEPDEALLFRNKSAALFGEQKMTPQQLQILHPIHLGHQSPDNLYQKTHRAAEKVRALTDRGEEGELEGTGIAESGETVALLKILLEVEREQSK
jgi:hypothetical protein